MYLEKNRIYNIDCIVGMQQIETGSVDMLLCDLPYGVTECKWDKLIPLPELWREFERIIKDNGAIVLTSAQPFTTELIGSNRKMFRYCWYWLKNQVTGFPFAKVQPLRCVEDICVFYKKKPTYNPQGLIRLDKPQKHSRTSGVTVYRSGLAHDYETAYTNYPRQTLNFKCQREGLHPTQKPVALFEYLIKTYTDEGELVVDCCIGSGTTAEACIKTNRKFLGFELDTVHFNTASSRINIFLETGVI